MLSIRSLNLGVDVEFTAHNGLLWHNLGGSWQLAMQDGKTISAEKTNLDQKGRDWLRNFVC